MALLEHRLPSLNLHQLRALNIPFNSHTRIRRMMLERTGFSVPRTSVGSTSGEPLKHKETSPWRTLWRRTSHPTRPDARGTRRWLTRVPHRQRGSIISILSHIERCSRIAASRCSEVGGSREIAADAAVSPRCGSRRQEWGSTS
jgi:hypothetical protein